MLDAKTSTLLWAAETLTLAVLLGTLWLHRPSRRHNLYFAAGFLAALIAGRDISDSLDVGARNAAAVLGHVGARPLKRMEI